MTISENLSAARWEEVCEKLRRWNGWSHSDAMPCFSRVVNGALQPTMEPTFEKLLARLADHSVDFLLVGGVAVTLHGYTRLTEDVDILIRNSPDNVGRLLECLSGYGEGFAGELDPTDFTDEEGAIRIVEEAENSQLDVFTRMSGSSFEDLAKDAEIFSFGGRQVFYASKATLISLKGRSVREKDQLDVAALKRLENDPNAFD